MTALRADKKNKHTISIKNYRVREQFKVFTIAAESLKPPSLGLRAVRTTCWATDWNTVA